MEREREYTLHAVSDAVVFKELQATFRRTFVLPKSDQILVHDEITGIPVYFKEAMTKLVLDTLNVQRKGVDSRLATTLQSFIECIVKKVIRSSKTMQK